MKATIHADQGDTDAKEKEYERLIVLDPEVSSAKDAEKWMKLLLADLNDFRQG